MDYKSVNIKDLCTRQHGSNIEIVCFPTSQVLLSFAWKFKNLRNSSLFFKAWTISLEEAKVKNTNLSVSDLESVVWAPAFQYCQKLLRKLRDLSITLGEVDRCFQDFTEDEITFEIKHLSVCLMQQQSSDGWVQEGVCKIVEYRKLCSYRNVATSFLKLKGLLGISEADFRDVEKVSTEVCLFNCNVVCSFYFRFCSFLLQITINHWLILVLSWYRQASFYMNSQEKCWNVLRVSVNARKL